MTPRDAQTAAQVPVNRVTQVASSTRTAQGASGAPAKGTPPAVAAAPDLPALLRALKRRWLLALFLGLLVAGGVAAALMYLMPTKYVAYATLQVAFAQDTPAAKSAYRNDFPIFLKTQAARIKSRDVLLKALSQEQVRNLAVIRSHPDTLSVLTWLEEYLKVDFQDSMELLTVSLPGESPEELAVVVNAITNSYLAILNDREHTLRRERMRKMEAFEAATKEKLIEKIAERQSLYKGQAPPDSAAEMQRHASLYAQKLDATREHWRLKGELDKLKGRIEAYKSHRKILTVTDVPESTINALVQSDLTMRDKLVSAAKWEKNVEELVAAGHKPNDSTLLYAKSRLESLQKEVSALRAKVRAEHLEVLQRKAEADYTLSLEAMQNEMAALHEQVSRSREYQEQVTKETEKIGARNATADLINTEIKQYESKLETIVAQVKNLQFEEEADPRVSACQEAVWQVKDAKRRVILLIMIPLLALIATALFVAWREFRARKIHSADDVEHGLGMRVVGAVPRFDPIARFLGVSHPARPGDVGVLESIDAIRTRLLHDAQVETTRLVMVTSAVSGEGKTTLAANLAASLARAGRRTLLVDGDLRRPALHQLFEQTLTPGLSEVLLGEVGLPLAVRPTTTDPYLWLLPAGQSDREVLQEMAKDDAATIFERLRGEFDFVIVDSHPVLAAADALLIGQHVDAAIVSVMRNLSRSPRVYAAYHRLSTLGVRIVGAVVNGVRCDEDEQSYLGSLQPQSAWN